MGTLATSPLLLHRPDWAAARERLTTWWNGGDIGRAALHLQGPRAEAYESVPEMAAPEGMVTYYTTKSLPWRVNSSLRGSLRTNFFAEAVPAPCAGDLAPNCLALYLGCHGVEMPGTVWCKPCMAGPDDARFDYNPDSFYWRFTRDAMRQVAVLGKGKMLQSFPDLIEGLDTLAAMRGTEELLFDLVERPDWVHACLRQITDRYFHYYDMLYDIIRDEVGGSVFWCWAPGRMAKFQCDFSAMISPEMFGEFMVPVLKEMTERVSYCMYHWDGPGAIPHHDHLLSLPNLHMLQWTPGDGAEPASDPRWWPMFHKTIDAGKKIHIGVTEKEQLLALKREFGVKSKQMLLGVWHPLQPREAEEWMRMMEC